MARVPAGDNGPCSTSSLDEANLQLIGLYLAYLADDCAKAENTLAAYRQDLLHFNSWLQDSQLSIIDVDNAVLSRYLIWRMTENFKPSSNARIVSCLKGFYRQLLISKKIQSDPCFGIKSAKNHRPVPIGLSLQEVDKLLAAPNATSNIGLRDKAMLEMLYATGMKISELIGLRLQQVNLQLGLISLAQGAAQSRAVPLTSEALFWLKKYLKTVRKNAEKQPVNDWLFLSNRAGKMTRQTFWYRMQCYAQQALITQPVSPESLRRAFATHLLENGANLLWVQSMLGHAEVSSTQCYSRIMP